MRIFSKLKNKMETTASTKTATATVTKIAKEPEDRKKK